MQRKKRCPLYPRKRTCAVQLAMSALGQQRTLPILLDHIVGAGYQLRRNSETECLGGPEVDREFEFCRQLNWKIARLLALENAGDINASTAVSIRLARAITDQSSGSDEPAKHIARRDGVDSGEPNQ